MPQAKIVLVRLTILNMGNKQTPEGWHTVTPRIVARDAAGLAAFLKDVFGAMGKWEEERPTIITIGDTKLMISEAGERNPTPSFLYVYVDDTDETYARAIKSGATSIEAPGQTPYGDYRAMIKDKWGNLWQIATYQSRK